MHVSFCSQVFKRTSSVLNSDVNIVNIALIAFCLLAVTNLTYWPMSSLRRRNTRYKNPEKAKTNDNCSKLSASDPHKSKTFNVLRNIVLLLVLGRCFAFFALGDQFVVQQKYLLRVEESCCEK